MVTYVTQSACQPQYYVHERITATFQVELNAPWAHTHLVQVHQRAQTALGVRMQISQKVQRASYARLVRMQQCQVRYNHQTASAVTLHRSVYMDWKYHVTMEHTQLHQVKASVKAVQQDHSVIKRPK